MTREEAIQILSTRDAHGVLCGYTSGVTEALDMAIEALKADTEGEDTQTAERARLVAKETELAYVEAKLENAEKRLDSTKDCTKFLLWLLEEIMDEENWEMNAVADGEIIARKLKNLGLLEVKDGYYVRTSLTYGLQEEERESILDRIKNWRKK